jgi:hypothetical protein
LVAPWGDWDLQPFPIGVPSCPSVDRGSRPRSPGRSIKSSTPRFAQSSTGPVRSPADHPPGGPAEQRPDPPGSIQVPPNTSAASLAGAASIRPNRAGLACPARDDRLRGPEGDTARRPRRRPDRPAAAPPRRDTRRARTWQPPLNVAARALRSRARAEALRPDGRVPIVRDEGGPAGRSRIDRPGAARRPSHRIENVLREGRQVNPGPRELAMPDDKGRDRPGPRAGSPSGGGGPRNGKPARGAYPSPLSLRIRNG